MSSVEIGPPPPSTEGQGEGYQVDIRHYDEQLGQLIPQAVRSFNRAMRPYVLISCAFLSLLLIEGLAILLFFSALSRSALLAVALAGFFLTVFAYFVLRLYYQAKHPSKFLLLRDHYLEGCKKIINYQEGLPEHHMALATAASKFALALNDLEYRLYRPPRWLEVLAPSMERFSCWWHWQDVHQMRELLHTYAIREHLRLVHLEPTNLEVHAALANAYVMLSQIYANPTRVEGGDEDRWIPQERSSEEMQARFRETAQRAIEEFKILNDYSPNDPWVHSQLAYSYRDLQMPAEEIEQYKIILQLRPNDRETLFKLGMLYFQEGQNAQGLQVYERLRQSHYKKAEALIKFYGSGLTPPSVCSESLS